MDQFKDGYPLCRTDHRVCEVNGDQGASRRTGTKIPDIPLEMSDRRRSYTSKKRDGHFDETSASPANASRKKPRQNFELKPRHKTREDRYDYKPNSVEAKSHAKKVKPRARRHTMNDDFHAMNVTENRLTMRRIVNLGIFSKGKASSNCPREDPQVSCTVPLPNSSHKRKSGSDLAFSEMNFFSKPRSQRNSSGHNPGTALAKNTLFNHSGNQQALPNPSEIGIASTCLPPIVMEREISSSPPPSLHFFKDLQRRRSPKKDVLEDIPVDHPEIEIKTPPPRGPVCKLQQTPKVDILGKMGRRKRTSSPRTPNKSPTTPLEPPKKRGKTSKSSSSIPYSWSDSAQRSIDSDRALEEHLLTMMHVGLNAQEISSGTTLPYLSGKSWTLPELRTLLEERMGLWSNDLSNTDKEEQGPPKIDLVQQVSDPAIQSLMSGSSERGRSGRFNVGGIRDKVFGKRSSQKATTEADCDVRSGLFQGNAVACTSQNTGDAVDTQDECELLAQREHNVENVPTEDPDYENPFLSHDEEPPISVFLNKAPLARTRDIDLHGLSRVEDENLFYRTLDAAFDTIMAPGIPEKVASDLQEHLSEAMSPYGIGGPLDQAAVSRKSPTPSCHDTGQELEDEHTVSFTSAIEHSKPEISEAGQSEPHPTTIDDEFHDSSNKMPWFIDKQSKSHPSSASDTDQRQTSVLSGFWRKNRLY
ncbi:unnamed protein product [Penicillium salamii]|uniref:Uncharacterized protein n=1 Tax=Penicillium salamii TaxID=1612424 RepID=A0A9W4IRS0_9EURO|nr:unnamed protein product [Penicillium salamii]CAG8045016.1 unnamed protein product [Penicillium salamii]CAG8066976.1 unnamed protein product [Penicillium salamii]CAG8223489.1 unnamed protein product [Penicillium salamii]CAG8267067.1 unnamed protein product [Penicillium salamii]